MSGRRTKRGQAVERARADLAAGRAWHAAKRLDDRLRNVGHDDEAMRLMGEIRAAMGDECEAGRWWLLSGATGEAVERAVDRYLAAHVNDVVAAIEAAPEAGRMSAVRDLPGDVLSRLARLGYPLPLDRSQTLLRRQAPERGWFSRMKGAGCLLLLLVVVVSLIVGVVAWALLGVRWLMGG